MIEVKSGKVKHKTQQFTEQKELANALKKNYIIYAPDITDKKYNELSSKGFQVCRNEQELQERNKNERLNHTDR